MLRNMTAGTLQCGGVSRDGLWGLVRMQEASGNDDCRHRVEDLVGERRDELDGHPPQVGAAVDADANLPHDDENMPHLRCESGHGTRRARKRVHAARRSQHRITSVLGWGIDEQLTLLAGSWVEADATGRGAKLQPWESGCEKPLRVKRPQPFPNGTSSSSGCANWTF